MELLGTNLFEPLLNMTLIAALSELVAMRVLMTVSTVPAQSDKPGPCQDWHALRRPVALRARKVQMSSP